VICDPVSNVLRR